MKKQDIVRLIECHQLGDHSGFRQQALKIAQEFDAVGDHEIGAYIMRLISGVGIFVPQSQGSAHTEGSTELDEQDLVYLERCSLSTEELYLPDAIVDDFKGAARAVTRHMGINRLLFTGKPGTGKTEAAHAFAKLLDRRLYAVSFAALIDSKLGETIKNIAALFREINALGEPWKAVVLFDEIDALALNRISSQDLREMGRAVSAFLKGLDELNGEIVLIATTNLLAEMDRALVRRFDCVIDFDRYERNDLTEIAVKLLDRYLQLARIKYRNVRLFKKILAVPEQLPSPGELKNLIKTAVGFSDPQDETDYLKRFYKALLPQENLSVAELMIRGFSVRELEILTGIPKSSVARNLRKPDDNLTTDGEEAEDE